MKIKCLAIDDEPLSLKIIEKYANEIPYLELVGTCPDALAAIEFLHKNQVDLLLLDINMPKLSGVSLVRSLARPPLVIFTTAYSKYAVEGFDLEAVDYLLKPFSFDRFLKAINKVTNKIMESKQLGNKEDHLFIKSGKKILRIDFTDILFLEAYGDYVKIHCRGKMVLTKQKLSELNKKLPAHSFLKIHRSFIIFIKAVDFIEGNTVNINKKKLPVSKSFRETLQARMKYK